MSVTAEPRGLTWINNVNMSTMGSLVTNFCWLVGSLVLTYADYQLLTANNELARQAGIFLTGILVTAWTGKTVAGVVDSNNKRTASPEYAPVLEAKERGKVAGAAAATALAERAADLRAVRTAATGERAAVQPAAPVVQTENVENVTVEDQKP